MKEFNLQVLMDRARAGWRTPAVAAALCVLLCLVLLSGSQPVYRTTMSVVPAPSEQNEVASNSASGALGSLLGLGGMAGNSTYARYQKLLSLPITAQRMQDKYGMLQKVYYAMWNKREKKWVEPITLRTHLLGWLFRLADVPIWTPPDTTNLAAYLFAKVTVLPSPQSDILTVTVNDPDPVFARQLMLADHEMANAVMRDQVARRARQQVAYLESKLSATTVEDYRQTLLALLSQQEKTLMLTQTDASFAAEILSPPTTSPMPVAPRPLLSVFIAILAGIMIGFGIVVFLGPDWWRAPYGWGRNLLVRMRGGRRVATQQH